MVLAASQLHAKQTDGGGEDFAQPSEKFPASWYPEVNHPASALLPVRDRPYIAKIAYSGNGWAPSQPAISVELREERDSKGRVRTESPLPMPEGMGTRVSITDPVAHCTLYWDEFPGPGSRQVVVACQPLRLSFSPVDYHFSDFCFQWEGGKDFRCEDLGKMTAAGLEAVGRRVHDNTQSAEKTDEEWYSPELVARTKREVVVGSNRFAQEFTSIRREEPDPADFYPAEHLPFSVMMPVR